MKKKIDEKVSNEIKTAELISTDRPECRRHVSVRRSEWSQRIRRPETSRVDPLRSARHRPSHCPALFDPQKPTNMA